MRKQILLANSLTVLNSVISDIFKIVKEGKKERRGKVERRKEEKCLDSCCFVRGREWRGDTSVY